MQTSQLLTEIRKLPLVERQNLLKDLSRDLLSEAEVEAEVDRILLSRGIIKEIPAGLSDEEENFEPLDFGKSLSEIILEDRR